MKSDLNVSVPRQLNGDEFVECRGERFRIFIEEKEVQRRVAEMGRQITADYRDKNPILIGVLNGAFIFVSDLMREITVPCEIDFLKLSSYGAAKVASGQVHELKRIDADIHGRHVIIVEDIIDTGHSMNFILESLEDYNPASLAVATFLHKAEATVIELNIDYVGFVIPNAFVIGYGLDYGQSGRNLRGIYIESPAD
ncbi:MAG: hypoxanthine phosphoribosyltransferase [Rhodothermales bacterium]